MTHKDFIEYYENQVKDIKGQVSIQLVGEDGKKTNYLNLNKESIKVIKEIFRNILKERSK